MLVDVGKLNIPAFQVAYGATEKYLKNNPNTVYAFLKAIAEGVVLSRQDPAVAKKAIAKYAKIDDGPTIDGTYDAFAPYWAMSLAVRPEAIRGQFEYIDEKEFPKVKNADPKGFLRQYFCRCPDQVWVSQESRHEVDGWRQPSFARIEASMIGLQSRRDIVYLALAGFFVTNAIFGELTGGKLFTFGPFTLSIGVIPWPVVFIATDLINEYFGREGVKRLTFMTIGLIVYAFVVLVPLDASSCGVVFAGDRRAVPSACSASRCGLSSAASSLSL